MVMKKNFIIIIILSFFLTPNLTFAQMSDTEASTLIQKANSHFSKKQYPETAHVLQKLYDCGKLKNEVTIYVLGYCYKQCKQNKLAVKYLEIAYPKLKKNQREYQYCVEILSMAYEDLAEYNKAIKYAQINLELDINDESKQIAHDIIGRSNFHLGYYEKAIESFNYAIIYLQRYLNINIDKIENGQIHNELLGEIYYNLSSSYYANGNHNLGNVNLRYAAKCGYPPAISKCHKSNIYL